MTLHTNLAEKRETEEETPSPHAEESPKQQSNRALVAQPAPRLDRIDREFLPAALEILNSPPSPVRMALLWMICAMFAATLAWSYFGWMDIHAVAPGKIQPSGRSKLLQPLEPGKVAAVYVENGSRVKAGDLIMELDPTETAADSEALGRAVLAYDAEIARRHVGIRAARDHREVPLSGIGDSALLEQETTVLRSDLDRLHASVESLKAQIAERKAQKSRFSMSIAARERLVAVLTERVDMRDALVSKNAGSRAMVIDAIRDKEREVATLATEQGQLLELDANVGTLERRIQEAEATFVADYMQKLADAQRQRDRTSQDLVKALSKNERTRLKAPISGTVQQLSVTTIGQVVGSGQQLMTIVPLDDTLEIEAMVLNSDIGFVEPGQRASVKIEAFPFTRYGSVEATVVRVSRDAVDIKQDDKGASGGTPKPGATQSLVFPATLTLKRQSIMVDGKEVPLMAGMAVTVEIKTGARRIIDYVMSPLREVTSSAGHER